MNLLIFGPQGSGKGTQADLLAEKYDLVHIETGQIFRDIALEDTELGRTILDLNRRKEMIPDNITIEVLRSCLKKVPYERGVIIDSAPRTPGQIPLVEELLESMGRGIHKAIYITLPFEESISRITKRYACNICRKHFVLGKDIKSIEEACPECNGVIEQRGDDTLEGITKRLNTFYEVTIPVIEYYREKGLLVEIDGNKSREEVFTEIIKKIK